MSRTVRLIFVGRQQLFLASVARLFSREGYATEVVSASDRVRVSSTELYGAVFADAAILGDDKVSGMKEVSSNFPGIPVLMFYDPAVTSNEEMASMLLAGADDVIPYGLDKGILLAKIKAHLRRTVPCHLEEKLFSKDGEIRLCRNSRVISLRRNGRSVEVSSLTRREFELLALMLERQEEALSRFDLLENVWGERAGEMNSETVDRHVESLRKKLGVWGRKIKTLYGIGYTLRNGVNV